MQFSTAVLLAATLLASASPCVAQHTSASAGEATQPQGVALPQAPTPTPSWIAPDGIHLAPEAKAANPFKSIGGDLKHFFRGDNARFLGLASVLAVAAAPWDRETIKETQEHWAASPGTFKTGNVGGSFLVQMGAGLAVYGVGKATHNNEFAVVGGDLFRAQMVSQLVVQGVKFATRRPGPMAVTACRSLQATPPARLPRPPSSNATTAGKWAHPPICLPATWARPACRPTSTT